MVKKRQGNSTPRTMTRAPKQSSTWLEIDSLPEPLFHANFILEPLNEAHAALDFEALMSCRSRLRTELQWGDWPPEDFTLELNRADLRKHYEEFSRREAFAYTVLKTDRKKCLGCIYLERCAEVDGAQLFFWVIDDVLELEKTLLGAVLDWTHDAWSIDTVLVPLREANSRGITLARDLGLTKWDRPMDGRLASHLCFVSDPAISGTTSCRK